LHATKKTLEVQANTPLKLLKPFLKKTPAKDVAIAGVISLISDKFNGSITLCFPAGVFLKIYENMFGEKHTAITKELEDAAGELLNIIYGQAKIELNAKAGYDLKKALPTVLTGEKINISQQGRVPTVVLPFETDAGVFHIEIESEKH
jgi:chemotaxis protein CheX